MSGVGCARQCYLYETGVEPAGYSSPAIKSFNNKNGHVIISTSDIQLDATSIQLTVVCTDPMSQLEAGTVSTTATVTFTNPCNSTPILMSPLTQTDFSGYLWQPIFYPLPQASTVEDCGPIYYFLNGLEEPEPFTIMEVDGTFGFMAKLTEPEQTG